MSDNTPLEGFLQQVLSDPSLQEDLSQEDLAAMKAVFGNLFSGAPSTAQPIYKKPVNLHAFLDGEITDDDLFDDALEKKSDAALLQYLADQVDGSIRAITVLVQRATAREAMEEIGHLELQLMAAGWGIYDVQQAMARQSPILRFQTWQYRLKKLLLHEFHFINHWLRGRR